MTNINDVKTDGMTVLCRAMVAVGEPNQGKRSYRVTVEDLGRAAKHDEAVLLAVHYYAHVLARYPRESGDLDAYGMVLRQMVSDVVEQGLWPGSNLLDYAGTSERARLAGGSERASGLEVKAVLFRSIMGDDLNLALEVPAGMDETALCDSVIAVFQAVLEQSPEPQIELLDKALRYFRTYIGEGAYYGSAAAGQNLANRAFREAGGEAV